ncbi:hypothetical protein TNCV_4998021 [Trichonephila clavipes]|nr:hypothetical protein TNCV_4998021 [Trichonephila clavipes]
MDVRLHGERYLTRRQPNHQTFPRVHQNLVEYGSLRTAKSTNTQIRRGCVACCGPKSIVRALSTERSRPSCTSDPCAESAECQSMLRRCCLVPQTEQMQDTLCLLAFVVALRSLQPPSLFRRTSALVRSLATFLRLPRFLKIVFNVAIGLSSSKSADWEYSVGIINGCCP